MFYRQSIYSLRTFPILLMVLLLRVSDGACEEAKVTFVDTQPLRVAARQEATHVEVVIQNTASRPVNVTFHSLLAAGQAGLKDVEASLADPSAGRLEPNEWKTVVVRIQNAEALQKGYLVVLSNGTATAFRSLTLTAADDGCYSVMPLIGGLGSAFLVILVCGLRLRKEVPLCTRMGSAKWDFSTSWASNFTVASALLATTVALAALPEETYFLSKAGYSIVNVIFALLAGLAPLIYNILRRPKKPTTDSSQSQSAPGKSSPGDTQPPPADEPPVLQGWVGTFLFASFVTLGATVGQLIVDQMVLAEIRWAQLASREVTCISQVVLGILALVMVIYAGTSIMSTARAQAKLKDADLSDMKVWLRSMYSNSEYIFDSDRPPKVVPLRQWNIL